MPFELKPFIPVGLLVAGNVFHIVALSTPQWSIIKYTQINIVNTYGLWQECYNGGKCTLRRDYGKQDWERVTEAMACVGMVVGMIALAIAALRYFMNLLGREPPKMHKASSAVAAFIAAVFIVVCISVFAAHDYLPNNLGHTTRFGYSFHLCIAGAVTILVGGLADYFIQRETEA